MIELSMPVQGIRVKGLSIRKSKKRREIVKKVYNIKNGQIPELNQII